MDWMLSIVGWILEVLACPPKDCTVSCPAHLFTKKGTQDCVEKAFQDCGALDVEGCPADTADLQVGDTFSIPFAIILPNGARAEAAREVTIVSPCDEGQNLCSDTCVPFDCQTYEALGSPNLAALNAAPDLLFNFDEASGLRRRLLHHSTDGQGPSSSGGSGSGQKMLQMLHHGKQIQVPCSDEQPGSTRRALLQDADNQDSGSVRNNTTVLELPWAYNYSVGSTSDIAWPSPYITPCQPGQSTECGVSARDPLGQNATVYAIPLCLESISSDLGWEEWKEQARRLAQGRLASGESQECVSEQCSPLQAERGQCSPGRYGIRYDAVDSKGRVSFALLFLRVEAGARYVVKLQMALTCSADGEMDAKMLQEYLRAAGVNPLNLRKVSLQGGVNMTDIEVHPGIDPESGSDGMPRLCLAEAVVELQVGCTPETEGFQSVFLAEKNETINQWCPCNIKFDPTYENRRLELEASSMYPVREGLYGPLLGFSPGGSNLDDPSPYCHALT
ncbi:hypothetical protein DUNSADRAFT_17744 [Dunaliella salina]|uniref:Uncharacterized protein n=1 Tax=Dunaliella salina TaxID=3046 RepID=A0ABQ7G189_DUNSA|nr:hypothetical protein DUNSADRAFT_17744 [Dunaliella salina]|eukprot:KAF5828361.1 hypothetical protein DUNSADRAFT_17744 [Dunaliella salina]